MMEANSCLREIKHKMYTQLRQDVCMKQVRRWQGREVEMGMAVMLDGRMSQSEQVLSGWRRMPRGRKNKQVNKWHNTCVRFL